MESNQGPRTERLTEASPPGRATEAHGDARAPLTTKPSSSSPSVGIKKAPTGRASSPSLSPRSIKPPPSRRPPSVASSSADGDNRKVPKPWWEALARLAFELRGEAAAQRAAHTTDLGILQQQQLALRARARIDKLQNAVDSGGGGSTLALSGAALGAVAPQRRWSKRRATRRHCSACWNGALRFEADGAQESTEAAEREALAASAELARLHSQLMRSKPPPHVAATAAAARAPYRAQKSSVRRLARSR